ncbi:MAG: hypothetical protein B6D61_10985 [Bacteroidetes bacterium 4484_249]|nr:MAG: hypothetical protein B6D61_10985 [Bacteroidetes bacterium 4484_249]
MKICLKLGCLIISFVIILLTSCNKEESKTETTNDTTITTKAVVQIIVENLSGVVQTKVNVDMFDKEISNYQTSTIIKSETTNSSGIATFDLESMVTNSPKTFYFGVFQQNGNSYELIGSKKVEGVKKGVEISTNLVLIN